MRTYFHLLLFGGIVSDCKQNLSKEPKSNFKFNFKLQSQTNIFFFIRSQSLRIPCSTLLQVKPSLQHANASTSCKNASVLQHPPPLPLLRRR
eukprot:m.234338 g.234338  ORF g.234338 m.234338 type:complete len:92 (+) comp13915_c0_seq1:2506-2781(+)